MKLDNSIRQFVTLVYHRNFFPYDNLMFNQQYTQLFIDSFAPQNTFTKFTPYYKTGTNTFTDTPHIPYMLS